MYIAEIQQYLEQNLQKNSNYLQPFY